VPNWEWSKGNMPDSGAGGVCEVWSATGAVGLTQQQCTDAGTAIAQTTVFWSGRQYEDGAFFTEAQANQGRCNRGRFSWTTVTAEQCANAFECSAQCNNLCQSSNRWGGEETRKKVTLCKAPATIDRKNCTNLGGEWVSFQSNSYCAMAHNNSESACKALGADYNFFSCRSSTTKATCDARKTDIENGYFFHMRGARMVARGVAWRGVAWRGVAWLGFRLPVLFLSLSLSLSLS
jgi:hypothetical protein